MAKSLPSLKSKAPTTLLSHVVYHIKCPRCNSSYVVQTTRHLATRLQERSRASSYVGTHLLNCGQAMENATIENLRRNLPFLECITVMIFFVLKLSKTFFIALIFSTSRFGFCRPCYFFGVSFTKGFFSFLVRERAFRTKGSSFVFFGTWIFDASKYFCSFKF